MTVTETLTDFFAAIANDPRINSTHISLYAALIGRWHLQQYANPICVFSKEVMQAAKISGSATYHKSIRELNEYGYIRYIPSYNHNKGSQIYFQDFK